ncbi:hypothetical protein CH63R_05760 [Colletotrichum higginsianum IMI 349063]|uniref:Uncharacterized protein n=1 Tax=Colletotrichum higginsianum (strain IMI 349063) TaxID=759273 RepID=A0A1B7YE33_COLHI|nr:hypothetical protein CH63R_05760 [Colletotrichum higginsianum IMI 349063]OBR10068.1 hypothetical protein CH63R_05760 [Colletotrichum higginsianum IMI 349063]
MEIKSLLSLTSLSAEASPAATPTTNLRLTTATAAVPYRGAADAVSPYQWIPPFSHLPMSLLRIPPGTHESPWHGTAPRILLWTRHCFVAYLGRSGADMADSTPEQSFCLRTLAALHLPPPPGMVDTGRRLLLEGHWMSNLRPHRDKIGRGQASGIASVSVLPSCPQSLEGPQPPTHDSQEQEVPHGRNNHDQSRPATSESDRRSG